MANHDIHLLNEEQLGVGAVLVVFPLATRAASQVGSVGDCPALIDSVLNVVVTSHFASNLFELASLDDTYTYETVGYSKEPLPVLIGADGSDAGWLDVTVELLFDELGMDTQREHSNEAGAKGHQLSLLNKNIS